MSHARRTSTITLLAAGCLALLFATDLANGTELREGPEPLRIIDENGKALNLYRRLVSKPGGMIVATPGSDVVVDEPTVFSTHYIFEERMEGGETFLRVGPPGRRPLGWMKAHDGIEWPNNVSLVSQVPVERLKMMFFGTLPGATAFHGVENVRQRALELIETIETDGLDELTRLETDITAIEGDQYVNWQDEFYLMPVLEFQEGPERQGRDLYVRTAATPLNPTGQAGACQTDRRAGVVFVIDTTASMGAYIDRTRIATETIMRQIQAGVTEGEVSFALVGYRDDPSFGEGIEYRSRVYKRLDLESDQNSFPEILQSVEVATGSTQNFSEDALAGLLDALAMDWSPFTSRWIIMITDASPRPMHLDDAGITHTIRTMATELRDTRNIGLVAIHLMTEEASRRGDLRDAEQRLKALARWENVDEPYVPVPNGDLDAFGSQIDGQIANILEQVSKWGPPPGGVIPTTPAPRPITPVDRIGYAQHILWLGKCDDTAPSVLQGWTVTGALHRPDAKADAVDSETIALQPRILLTRQQLDNLVRVLSAVMEAAEQDMMTPQTFFTTMVESLAIASLDANELAERVNRYRSVEDFVEEEVDTIRDLMPSYLGLIPFKTDLLTTNERSWRRMSRNARDLMIKRIRLRIEELITLYNSDGWVKLHPDSARSEEVMPILTDFLP